MVCAGRAGDVVSRRGFLKILGAGAAAVVAAPLLGQAGPALALPAAPALIKPERLEFGVPRRVLATSSGLTNDDLARMFREQMAVVDRLQAAYRMGRSIPMLMLQDNYLREYGGRIKAGSTLLVDDATADRWLRNGVAVRPDASAAEAARVIPGRDNRYARSEMSSLEYAEHKSRAIQGRMRDSSTRRESPCDSFAKRLADRHQIDFKADRVSDAQMNDWIKMRALSASNSSTITVEHDV